MKPDSQFLLELAHEALDIMAEVRERGFATSFKTGLADPVTLADTRIEEMARARILADFPQHRIVGEEGGEVGSGEAVWYLDPVDGTMNYARDLPFACFTGAFALGELELGVVAHPTSGEVFHAARGEGAFLGANQLRISDKRDFRGSVVLLELEEGCRPWPGMLDFMTYLASQEATVRIMGSSALALAQVAAGRAELFMSGRLQPYDKAAGLLLIREAGGEIGPRPLEAGAVTAGVPELVKLALSFRR